MEGIFYQIEENINKKIFVTEKIEGYSSFIDKQFSFCKIVVPVAVDRRMYDFFCR